MAADAPPAAVEPSNESERDFRRWVRLELAVVRKEQKHQTEMLKMIGSAVELLVKERGLDHD